MWEGMAEHKADLALSQPISYKPYVVVSFSNLYLLFWLFDRSIPFVKKNLQWLKIQNFYQSNLFCHVMKNRVCQIQYFIKI